MVHHNINCSALMPPGPATRRALLWRPGGDRCKRGSILYPGCPAEQCVAYDQWSFFYKSFPYHMCAIVQNKKVQPGAKGRNIYELYLFINRHHFF